jgi:hypothetical protein
MPPLRTETSSASREKRSLGRAASSILEVMSFDRSSRPPQHAEKVSIETEMSSRSPVQSSKGALMGLRRGVAGSATGWCKDAQRDRS